jgi:hypothetical protein
MLNDSWAGRNPTKGCSADWRRSGKVVYSRTGHRWQYGVCALHARYLRQNTHTHTHTEYVILIASPLQQGLHERASLLRHTYNACTVAYFKQTWTKTHVDLLTEAHLVHNYSWKFEDAFTTPIMEMTVTVSSHSNVSMCLRRNSVDTRHGSQVTKSAY